jgi:hypothetical protein
VLDPRLLALTLFVALIAVVDPSAPSNGGHAAADEALCDRLATTTTKRTAKDFRAMSVACAHAAAWYRHRAALATGPPRQQELILQGAYLYFTAEAEAGLQHLDRAVALLKDSRTLYEDVRAHALTDDARHKAQMGLRVVDLALRPESSQTK